MNKKEEFKNFVKSKPELIDYVRNNEVSPLFLNIKDIFDGLSRS